MTTTVQINSATHDYQFINDIFIALVFFLFCKTYDICKATLCTVRGYAKFPYDKSDS